MFNKSSKSNLSGIHYQWMNAFICVIILVTYLIYPNPQRIYAQTIDEWSEPLNLSSSGASSNPVFTIDSNQIYHAIWLDLYDGYRYTRSEDGITWSAPVDVKLPFSTKDNKPNSSLVLKTDRQGRIHAFWLDDQNNLMHSLVLSSNFSNANAWYPAAVISKSVIQFDVSIDNENKVHLAFVSDGIDREESNAGIEKVVAGIYYRRFTIRGVDGSWENAEQIYQSQYFRTLDSQNANVTISASTESGPARIYIAWDVKPLKKLFIAISDNGGSNWGAAKETMGPRNISGNNIPLNITVDSYQDKALILYQIGVPGSECTQYSQWSTDGGETWNDPKKILNEFSICPKITKILQKNNDYFILMLDYLDDLSFLAWNGDEWSESKNGNNLSSFQNPDTFDPVIYRCRQVVMRENEISVVGCDIGVGGDIWFTKGTFGTIESWYPDPSRWSTPSTITSNSSDTYALTSLVASDDNTQVFWVAPALLGSEEDYSIFHSQWDGARWSLPNQVVVKLKGIPSQLAGAIDQDGRLLLAWVDGSIGQLYFAWVSTERASIPAEWSQRQLLAPEFSTISSPDLIVDSDGNILIFFAVPFNEKRGVYYLRSDDRGTNWSNPVNVFDAVTANWDMVNHPRIDLAQNGQINLLLTKFSAQSQAIGLYYSSSLDGGGSWRELEEVSDYPIYWSEIISSEDGVVHRFWQEKRSSLYVNLHQVSYDSGSNWDRSSEVSFVRDLSVPPAAVIDDAGKLHFVQLSNPDNLTVLYSLWDGTRWNTKDTIRLRVPQLGESKHMVTACITPAGFLKIFVTTNEISQTNGSVHKILSSRRFLDLLPSNLERSVIIPTPNTPTSSRQVVSTQPTETSVSPFENLNEPPQKLDSNLVGIVISGSILLISLAVGVVVIIINRRNKVIHS